MGFRNVQEHVTTEFEIMVNVRISLCKPLFYYPQGFPLPRSRKLRARDEPYEQTDGNEPANTLKT